MSQVLGYARERSMSLLLALFLALSQTQVFRAQGFDVSL